MMKGQGATQGTAGEKATNQQERTFQAKDTDQATPDNNIKIGVAQF